MNLNKANALLLLVGVVLMLFGAGWAASSQAEPNYQYTVKTEQVESDSNSITDSVALADLDEGHERAIFKAWKKSDHFLGGASAHVELDQKLNLTEAERWQVVEVEGVNLLVGIHGPDERHPLTAGEFVGFLILMGAAILTMVAVLEILD